MPKSRRRKVPREVDLDELIDEAIFQFQYTLYWGLNVEDKKYHIMSANPRYGIRCKAKSAQLKVIDFFTGTKKYDNVIKKSNYSFFKIFNFIDNPLKPSYGVSYLEFISISLTRIFVFDYDSWKLHLVDMNWEKCTCSVLETHRRFDQILVKIVFDRENPNRFLFIADPDGSIRAYCGLFNTDKSFIIGETSTFQVNTYETCLRFIGNKCYALSLKGNGKVDYLSFDLTAAEVKADIEFTFEMEGDADLQRYPVNYRGYIDTRAIKCFPYAWYEDVCYVFSETQILAFNTQTGRCSSFVIRPNKPIVELSVCSNEFLTMQTDDRTIHRIPLRQVRKRVFLILFY
jgi:hypothetical protein